MALVGAWNAKTDADREVVGALAGRPYDEVEAGLARLRPLEESPVWSVGAYRGVASKIDSLFAVSHLVTERHLTISSWSQSTCFRRQIRRSSFPRTKGGQRAFMARSVTTLRSCARVFARLW